MIKRKVDASSLGDLKAFLRQNKLPFDDVSLDGNAFFIYSDGNEIVGSGGIEFYGDYALLRSIAVAPALRQAGRGKEIVHDIIEIAKGKSSRRVYLLTETAPVFFERLGFVKQQREDAPEEIKSSSEFSSVCPVSAAMMYLEM